MTLRLFYKPTSYHVKQIGPQNVNNYIFVLLPIPLGGFWSFVVFQSCEVLRGPTLTHVYAIDQNQLLHQYFV